MAGVVVPINPDHNDADNTSGASGIGSRDDSDGSARNHSQAVSVRGNPRNFSGQPWTMLSSRNLASAFMISRPRLVHIIRSASAAVAAS